MSLVNYLDVDNDGKSTFMRCPDCLGVLWRKTEDFNLDSEPKTEKKPKEIGFSEKREFVEKPSEPIFQCQICKQSNRPMFFANGHDLQLHVERIHNNNPDYGVD